MPFCGYVAVAGSGRPLHLTRPSRCCMIAVAAWWCFSAFVLIFIASFLPFAGLVLRDDNYDSYGTFRMFCAHHFWNTSWKAWVGETPQHIEGGKTWRADWGSSGLLQSSIIFWFHFVSSWCGIRWFVIGFCFSKHPCMWWLVSDRAFFWGANSMSPISLCIPGSWWVAPGA